MIADRNLLSFGLLDMQTGSLSAIIGIPCEVPVPKNVIFIYNKNNIKID
jgi:hypothetical protein